LSEPPAGSQPDLRVAEAESIRFHETAVADAATIWRDGLNALLRGLDVLISHVTVGKDEDLLMAFIVHAWNTLYRAHEEALRGYYSQALNLLRMPVEDFVAYWYVRSYPDKRPLFYRRSKHTPRVRAMLGGLRAKFREQMGEEEAEKQVEFVEQWINELAQFSHIDRAGVWLVLTPVENRLDYRLGPIPDADLFRFCTAHALRSIGAHMEALDNLRRLLGYEPLEDFAEWADRIEQWQRAQKPAGRDASPP